DALARLHAELGRRPRGGMRAEDDRRIELELAGLELLEQHVERHDLGERRRVANLVRIGIGEYGARIRVDDDGGRRRAVAGPGPAAGLGLGPQFARAPARMRTALALGALGRTPTRLALAGDLAGSLLGGSGGRRAARPGGPRLGSPLPGMGINLGRNLA